MHESVERFPIDFVFYETLLLIFLIGIPIGAFFYWKKYNSFPWFVSLFLVFWGIILYGTYLEPQKLVVREFEKEIEGFSPLRIVVLSDIHVGPYKQTAWVQKITDTINKIEDIDAVLILGDFMFGGGDIYSHYLKPLKDIQIKNKFFILGNHDHYIEEPQNTQQSESVITQLESLGFVNLNNKNIWWKEQNLSLIGVDDNYLGYHDIPKAFKDTNPKDSQILLAHSPDIWDEITQGNYKPNLTLSGHTHCGQIRLPFLGALPYIIPTDNGKKLEKGWYEKNNQSLFVTCGAGESGPRSRLFNPPEIVIININNR